MYYKEKQKLIAGDYQAVTLLNLRHSLYNL